MDAAFNSGFLEGKTQTYRLEDVRASVFRIFLQWLYSQKVHAPLERYGYIEENDDSPTNKDDAEATDLVEAERQEGEGLPIELEGRNGSLPGSTQEIDNDEEVEDDDPALTAACKEQELDLAQAWVLGEKFLIPSFQNAVLRKFDSLWRGGRLMCWNWLPYAYENTKRGSPLRNLIVDQWAYVMKPDPMIKTPEFFPKEMLIELAFTLSMAITPLDPNYSSGLDGLGRQRYVCDRTWRLYHVDEDDEP